MDVANEFSQINFPWPSKLARLYRSVDRLRVSIVSLPLCAIVSPSISTQQDERI